MFKEKVPTVEKKSFVISPSLFRKYIIQTRSKMQIPSKGYLAVVNYRLFSKIKISSVISTSFSVDFVMNPITENVLDFLP